MDREPSSDWSSATEELLVGWSARVGAVEAGHYMMADRLSRGNVRLGVPVVILSGLVGTSVFATLQEEIDYRARIVIGLISVLTAVLASLQTFLRYAERAEKHRVAAALYSSLRREMEELLVLPVEARGPSKESLDRLREQMDQLGKESPEIGEWAWQIVAKRFNLPAGARRPGPTRPEASQLESTRASQSPTT
jgi:SMODS and SLOG-associating 2TM effector domain family 4